MERRRPVAAGALIGLLCAIKPNYLVWPVLLAISGSADVAIVAGLATAVLSVIPAVVYGPVIYAQWYHVASQVSNVAAPANASLAGAIARFGAPAWAGLACGGLLLVGLAFWARQVKPDRLRVSGVALVAAVLASPLGWVDYTLLLLPVFLSRRWTWAWWCAALLLVTFMGYTWWMLQAPHWVLASVGQYASFAVVLVLMGLLYVPRRTLEAGAEACPKLPPPIQHEVAVEPF